jgi:hypothetical protein
MQQTLLPTNNIVCLKRTYRLLPISFQGVSINIGFNRAYNLLPKEIIYAPNETNIYFYHHYFLERT